MMQEIYYSIESSENILQDHYFKSQVVEKQHQVEHTPALHY
jgi:hypothetical protein